jgi:NADPH:quinone reductase-like Zn-dependent oxidoreductase
MKDRRADVGTMKAIVCNTPGRLEALQLVEIPTPAVADDGLLVRVRACSINPLDFFTLSRAAYLARLVGWGFKAKPVVVGTDFAGIVESVGKNVTQVKPGDAVFGATKGAFAEYVAIPEREVARKPANATFEQAAATPVAGVTALQALRDHGRLQAGQKVLINGGSGGVGTFAVQIAKHLEGTVTAVCSPNNLEMARAIGADRVIDYTREDFTTAGASYDVLIDIAGSHRWSEYTRVLTAQGIFVPAGASTNTVWGGGRTLRHLASIRLRSFGASRKAAFFIAKMNRADLDLLRDLIESGRVTPVIDRRYELGQVADAMAYMGDGHARGKVVVSVA